MDLDDVRQMRAIDQSNMLGEIETLPDQLEKAWKIAEKYSLPTTKSPAGITIAGMGGSAIGGDMLAAYAYDLCEVPISVVRGYSLPKWIGGKDQLVICSSHSGNTEETLSIFEQAVQRGCTTMAVSKGGELKKLAEKHHCPFWLFEHKGQPRSAVGFSFGMLLNLISRMKLIPEQDKCVESAVEAMRRVISEIDVHIPVTKNQAKRIAGQAYERQAVIVGAEHLEPIARRWKTQINEMAKGWAAFEFMPEANHNTLAGLENPESVLSKIYALFLHSKGYHSRNQKRFMLTFEQFMVAGLCTDLIEFDEQDKISEMWRMLVLGDFVSFYLAMLYAVDPTPIDSLEEFKKDMRS